MSHQLNAPLTKTIPELAPKPTQPQVNAFRQTGVGVVRQMIRPDEAKHILQAYMKATENGPVKGISEVRQDGSISDIENDPLARYPRMLMQHRHLDTEIGQIALKYMLDKRIEHILKALLKENPIAAQSMFYFKPPGARGQSLHQDNNPLAVDPGTCIAVWIALEKTDAKNGALMVVPGTGPLDLLCDAQTEDKPDLFFTSNSIKLPDDIQPIPAEMNAGDALIFNGQVIHGSFPNTTDDRWRRVLIFHYVPESCKQVAGFYHPLLDFDGNEVKKNISPTGGLCGQWRENKVASFPKSGAKSHPRSDEVAQ